RHVFASCLRGRLSEAGSAPPDVVCSVSHLASAFSAAALSASPCCPVKRAVPAPMETWMFVEGVRLFIVVLGTAAGFWAARTFGPAVQGLGGMLGCLLGYVSGGILGRVTDRAVSVVERRVERRSPARFLAGTLGAIAGSALALVLVLPFTLLVPIPFAVSMV